MSLILPKGPSWAYCSDNLPSTPSTSTAGTTVTANATPNTDGTAVTLLSALAHDVEYLVIGIRDGGAVTTNTSALLDILADPAGGTSWAEIIGDLLAGYAQVHSSSTSGNPSYLYEFPLWIPAGTSVGARVRCATGSTAIVVNIWAYGGNSHPGSWTCGQRVQTIGTMDAANSRGQAHTSGNTGTFSSWTDLGSTLASRGIAAQYACQGIGGTTINNRAYHFEFGAGSTRRGPRLYHFTGTNEIVSLTPSGVNFQSIGAGTQMQVRGTCSGTAESVDVAAYITS